MGESRFPHCRMGPMLLANHRPPEERHPSSLEEAHEPSNEAQVHQRRHGCNWGYRRRIRCCTRNRTVNARGQMALDPSWPRSLDVPFGACETVANYVAEATDNKFQIQLFAAGEIVPALQVLDAVQNGSVEMCHTATYYFIGKDPTWALFCAVPFGLNTRQQNAWYYDGDGLKLMNEFGKKYNVYSLVSGNTGAQMGGWFRKEINTVDDL